MKALLHFLTITRHHNLVMGYCFRAGLYRQGLLHDLSKYSPAEFLVGAKYYQGNRSPNNAEREDIGVSTAWLHHKGRNRHHFEYWIDYTKDPKSTQILAGAQMPRKYVAEMIFDRVSASRVYRGEAYTDRDPLDYYLHGTRQEMEFLLRMWAEKGEEYTIGYIRYVYLKKGERKH